MAHPTMFDPADPYLARFRELAFNFPGAAEKVSHGRPAFYTTKVFAYFGFSQKVDGAWSDRPHVMVILPDADEREALVGDPRTFVPPYLGHAGWLAFQLPAPRSRTGWVEVAELLETSYRNTARRALVAELDARATS